MSRKKVAWNELASGRREAINTDQSVSNDSADDAHALFGMIDGHTLQFEPAPTV